MHAAFSVETNDRIKWRYAIWFLFLSLPHEAFADAWIETKIESKIQGSEPLRTLAENPQNCRNISKWNGFKWNGSMCAYYWWLLFCTLHLLVLLLLLLLLLLFIIVTIITIILIIITIIEFLLLSDFLWIKLRSSCSSRGDPWSMAVDEGPRWCSVSRIAR